MRSKKQAAEVLLVAALAAISLSACGVGVSDVDAAEDDSAVEESQLSSYPGLTEGSRDAIGVLKLATEGSQAQLGATGAGVEWRTVKSILATRNGPDGIAMTADDRPYTTLAKLYAVRYVGPVTMSRLIAYARAHGYVPPPPPPPPPPAPVSPIPTCEGAPALPTNDDLIFAWGLESLFTRTCGSSGVCTPWKQLGYSRGVSANNGPRSLLLNGAGYVSVQASVGPGYTSQSGSSTYYCRSYDIGSGSVDAVTGVGVGQMRSGTRCDISGGSGGPSSENDQRAVALKLGTTCLSITDTATGPSVGDQSLRVIVLRR
jgi:hypothetical protein